MKLNNLSQRALLALAVLAGALASSDARAESTISWSTIQNITGDANVINAPSVQGVPKYALMVDPTSPTTVNGVTFSNTPPSNYSTTNLTGDIGPNPTGTGMVGTFGHLSANYQAVLAYGQTGTGSGFIGFTGLTAGQEYQFQIFVDNSAANGAGTEILASTTLDGNSNVIANTQNESGTIQYNTSAAAGGLGQYVMATFVADNTGSESVAFLATNGTSYVLINAGVLSPLNSVPEPSSIVMVGIGCVVGLGTYVRRRRTRSN